MIAKPNEHATNTRSPNPAKRDTKLSANPPDPWGSRISSTSGHQTKLKIHASTFTKTLLPKANLCDTLSCIDAPNLTASMSDKQ